MFIAGIDYSGLVAMAALGEIQRFKGQRVRLMPLWGTSQVSELRFRPSEDPATTRSSLGSAVSYRSVGTVGSRSHYVEHAQEGSQTSSATPLQLHIFR